MLRHIEKNYVIYSGLESRYIILMCTGDKYMNYEPAYYPVPNKRGGSNHFFGNFAPHLHLITTPPF